MKKILAATAVLVLSGLTLYAQTPAPICGTTIEDQKLIEPRLIDNLRTVEQQTAVSDRDAIQYVPIHFHLVGDATGAGKQLEHKLLDQLCDMNDAYAPMNIRFYLSPHPVYGLFDYSINNASVYSNQTNTFLMSARRHNNAENVFVVNEPTNSNNQPGIILAYYSPQYDWIVCRKSQAQGGKNGTLPHETGHFFSLMHTFYGYESDPFDPADAGWPIAPVTSPGGIPTEYQNESNCTTAADKICDTPPDYNFGYSQGNCVTYTQGAKDPSGTPVVPMEKNFMSYFIGCVPYAFTAQQQSTILADLASSHRNYLHNSFVPASTDITTPSDLLIDPPTNSISQYYDQVNFSWQAVTGATYYLLELDISSSFASPLAVNYITTATSKLVTNLLANRTYYWRVRPFNEYVTCAAASATRNLKTATVSATSTIQDVSAWQISPNPVSAGSSVRLSVTAHNNLEATVSVVNMAGQRMFSQSGVQFPSGESVVELPTANLSNGLYFVVLENEQGREVRKLSVLK